MRRSANVNCVVERRRDEGGLAKVARVEQFEHVARFYDGDHAGIGDEVKVAIRDYGRRAVLTGGIISKDDVSIAKNYLDGEELGTLNRIVNTDIEFAELRALRRKVMTIRDGITKLDEFLKRSEHELLDHAGKFFVGQAEMKAELEYDRYRVLLDSQSASGKSHKFSTRTMHNLHTSSSGCTHPKPIQAI